jgi:hypothetical protein
MDANPPIGIQKLQNIGENTSIQGFASIYVYTWYP